MRSLSITIRTKKTNEKIQAVLKDAKLDYFSGDARHWGKFSIIVHVAPAGIETAIKAVAPRIKMERF